MAAQASSPSFSSPPQAGGGPDRGSLPIPRDRAQPPSDAKPYSHIKDIIRSAKPTLDKNDSLTACLEEVEKTLRTSKSSLGLGRPDMAYKYYLTSYEIAANIIPYNKDFGFLTDNNRSWSNRYRAARQQLKDLEGAIIKARVEIEANNKFFGTTQQPPSVPKDDRIHPVVPSPRASLDRVSIDRTALDKRSSLSIQSDVPAALQPGKAKPPPPPSKPKPEALHGRPISGHVADLQERFAKLGGPNRVQPQSPATITSPEENHGKQSLEIVNHVSPTQPLQPSSFSPIRPVGPREMPVPPKVPNVPPKVPLTPVIALPKAPSPTYSPITVPPQASHGLHPRSPTQVSKPPSDKRKGYYGNTQTTPAGGLLPVRSREEIPSPYRPLTPNGTKSAIVPKSESIEIPHTTMLDPATLREYMAKYNVLIVDVRERTRFDEGHIMASSIICIDPISLNEGMSAEDLEDRLILAPDKEQNLFSRRNEFDIVVYYDQATENDRFLKGAPVSTSQPALRAFYDTLYEFNEAKPLKDGRPPALLRGGIDAWTDYIGFGSLAQSKTAASLGSTRARPARPLARRILSTNSRTEVRNRRLRDHKFLDEEEQKAWRRQAQQEEVVPEAGLETSDGEYVMVEDEPDTVFVPDYETFLRRFPSVHDQQSMMMPAIEKYPTPPARLPPAIPPPSIPARPPPAIPRPSYSGQADLAHSQASLARVASSSKAPLYSSLLAARSQKLSKTGLINFGVTCYMNSTLQCLFATVPMSLFFRDVLYKSYVQKNWKGSSGLMPDLYANVVRSVWKGDVEAIKPSTFRNFCGRMNREWVIDRQQDAKEFFDFLVDCLHEDLNVNWERTPLRPLSEAEEFQRERMPITQASPIEWNRYEHRDRSYISSLFAGQHASRLRCLSCGKTSTTYEAFYSISIEIPPTGIGSIYDCLKSYTQEEKLSELWRCPYCKQEREATKQIILTRLPQFLVIHFKRFAASHGEKAKKIHTPIEFPLHALRMDDFVIPYPHSQPPSYTADGVSPVDMATTAPFFYDAYGVLRHLGNSGDGGHYISIVRDPGRGVWRKFDDDRHVDIDPTKLGPKDRLQNHEAYIVFFQRSIAR